MRKLPWYLRLGFFVFGLAAFAFLIWTGAPLFVNQYIDEDLPTSVAIQPLEPTSSPLPLPSSTPLVLSPSPVSEQPTATETALPTQTPSPQPTATPAEPIVIHTGSFTQIDALHGADGQATIYRMPDQKLILRLEPFEAKNGPDLFVGLSGHPMPRNNDEVYGQGYTELARLKANIGNQNYELPDDIDLEAYQSVVIYCKAFSVVFSTAAISAP